ncbi:hypothetical protein KAU18_00930, partial [Candidatus Bathyarchaeota archaeon]|nr:hypothetical protein [Candidatus Bathyarchaeota archaeon]
ETPFEVLQSDFIYKGNNWVTLSLEIQNSAPTIQSTYIEVQALDSQGEIILDDGVELIQNSIAVDIPPEGTYVESFDFNKTGLKTELDVFLIILWWDTAQGVFTSGGGTSIPPKALVAFRGGTHKQLEYPKYRFYDVAWSDTHQLIDPADQEVRIVRSAWSTESSSTDNALIVLMTDMGYIDAYNYDGFSWDHDRLGCVWASEPDDGKGKGKWKGKDKETMRPFDFAYESVSGDAVLVYKDNGTDASEDIVYRVWDGEGWSEPAYIDDPAGRREYYWVSLASDPLTDQIAMIGVTGDGESNCWIWDGSSWGSHHRLSDSVTDVEYEVAHIAWEYTSGEVLAAVANGKYVETAVYDGSWTDTGSFSLVLNPKKKTPEVNWVVLKPHNVEGSNRIMFMALDGRRKLYTRLWEGSSWAGLPEQMDNKLQSADTRCFDGDWMPSGTSFILFAGQDKTKHLSYKVWTPSGWNPSGSGSWSLYKGATKKQYWIQVRSNHIDDYPHVVVGIVDSSKNLILTSWDGASLQDQTVASTHSTRDYESFEIAFSFPP